MAFQLPIYPRSIHILSANVNSGHFDWESGDCVENADTFWQYQDAVPNESCGYF